ncbi:MAG: patatin-like phospholipase family protein [Nitrospirota bacterium]
MSRVFYKRFYLLFLMVLTLAAASCAAQKAAVVQPPPKPARIAVVLGAGASRGFAHIGVLKVLEMNKVPINMIVGTSAGSFVGSLYAYGYDAYSLQGLAINIEKGEIADLCVPDNGFIKGDKLEGFVNKKVNNTPIERLKIPFYAVSTDIESGQEVVFGRGNTGAAVRASCSIPGIFRPALINGRMYVDGGVVSPIAVDAARRQGADVVIAVDISSELPNSQPQGTVDTILQSIDIMYSKISASQLTRADVVIRPKVGRIGSGDFEKRNEAIMEGEKAANEAMPKINAILMKLRQDGRL